ncbi:MAG: Rrf2 family transcriptional regulator [Ignavibacteriae bacterium]|nr:Rrf2 family transcriptional regulator [Ignavibacteriota bacterium]MCB9206688.1 Rrf2 family transcriptional regulator [Ignavibacteriales bacterium]MCB9210597.1 Rrf2 family transcriptional regulator [Ignavibacteriales bacterium]MCB9259195.1 Rrf2 family transcriptional regulator [Ignavibacteriales bacterium]
MIKISKSVEYSILALKYIADNENFASLSSRKISDDLNIPYDLLSKLLQKLVRKGIVQSQQGKYGGYNLLVDSNKLSLLNIIDALDENIQLANCTFDGANNEDCARINNCYIRSPFLNLQNKINKMFNEITLNELTN